MVNVLVMLYKCAKFHGPQVDSLLSANWTHE